MDAAVPEVPVEQPVQLVGAEQLAELPQVAAEPVRLHRRVLPAGPGLPVRGGPPAESRAVLPDPPDGRGLRPGRDHRGGHGAGVSHHGLGQGYRLGGGARAHLHHQPGITRGQLRDPGRSFAAAHHVHHPGVEALDGQRGVGQDGGHRVGRVGHVRVTEHDQRVGWRHRHQADRGAQHGDHGALGAGQRPGQAGPVLREQVLQGVPGHLAAQPAELGAQQAQVRRDQRLQAGHRVQAAAGREPPAGAVDDVEFEHVVRGAAVGQGVGTARVVADHPAERGPGLGGRVGAEAQPVRGRGRLEAGQDHPGLDPGSARLRVEVENLAQVPRGVQDDPGPDRVPRDGRAGPAGGQGRARAPGHLGHGQDVAGVPGKGHHLGHDPVVGGVAGVLGPAAGGFIHLAPHGRAQGLGDVGRIHACHPAVTRLLLSTGPRLHQRRGPCTGLAG